MAANSNNPHSTASIAGHPIHPMLIPFPLAFFVATFACDVAFLITGSTGFVTATEWLLAAGLIMGALAALTGLTDVLGDRQIRHLNVAWLHAGGNIAVVLIEAYNWYSRYAYGPPGVIPIGIILSGVVVLILLFTGWKGWEMVYRHRVGVADDQHVVR
ncbi:MAG TPA: DUF2231 domain-containing protein [Gammaproteobacteria bacterium]|nr:DUF2231 domain-containing protein [Gammaproteobacteria bacterium]